MSSIVLAFSVVNGFFSPSPVKAQNPSGTPSVDVDAGVNLNFTSLQLNDVTQGVSDWSSGLGGQLRLGFKPFRLVGFALKAGTGNVSLEGTSLDFQETTAEIRLSPSSSSRILPYLIAEIGTLNLGDDDLRLQGRVFGGGAGVRYFLTPIVAFDLHLGAGWGGFSQADVRGEGIFRYSGTDVRRRRFAIGATVVPFRVPTP